MFPPAGMPGMTSVSLASSCLINVVDILQGVPMPFPPPGIHVCPLTYLHPAILINLSLLRCSVCPWGGLGEFRYVVLRIRRHEGRTFIGMIC